MLSQLDTQEYEQELLERKPYSSVVSTLLHLYDSTPFPNEVKAFLLPPASFLALRLELEQSGLTHYSSPNPPLTFRDKPVYTAAVSSPALLFSKVVGEALQTLINQGKEGK